MKFRTTLVLLALVIGLGGFLVFYTWRKPGPREYVERERRVFPVEEFCSGKERLFDVASRIEIRNGPKCVVIERKPGDGESLWHITQPIQTPADAGEVFSSLSGLESMKFITALRDEPGKPLVLESFGLKEPRRSVTLTVGAKEWTLHVGSEVSDGKRVYVARAADRRTVFTVPRSVLDRVSKTVNELRHKSALRVKLPKVTGIEIRLGDNAPVECRRTASGWEIRRPIDDEAVAMSVSRLLKTIAKLNIAAGDFISDGDSRAADYGLHKPKIQVTVFEGNTSQALLVGSKAPDRTGKRYAKREGDPTIFLLNEKVLERLDVSPDALRTPLALPFDPDAVAEIEIRWANQETALRLTRESGAWRALQPAGAPVDSPKVHQFLRSLSILFIRQWTDRFTPELLEKNGLLHPEATVILKLKGANRTRELRFGKRAGRGNLCFARRGDKGPILLVPAQIAGRIAGGPLAFAPRVMLDFRRYEAVRLTIERPDLSIELERQGDEWVVTKPVRASADTRVVQALLRELSYIESPRVVAEKSDDLQRYGLDTPRLKLTAFLKAESREGQGPPPQKRTLLIGNRVRGAMAYAAVEDGDYVFLLGKSKLRDLAPEPSELSAALEAKP